MSAQFKDATNDAVQFLTKHGDLTRAAAYDAIRLLTGNGFVVTRTDLLPSATDLSKAAVAAVLEAAAVKSDDMATEWGKKREAAWRKKNATEEARVFDGMSLAALTVADAIRALITPAQHDALAAHVATEVAKARAEDAVKVAFPADVLEFALKIGRAEWGQTDPKTAAEHAADMASTVEKTAAYFGQTEPQSLNGLYIEGTGIVICHTGVSPNSPEIARILTGLWNMIYDTAQIGSKP